MSGAQVVVAAGVRADHALLTSVAEGEFDRLGVDGTVAVVDTAAAVRERLAAGTATVVLPGRDPEIRALMPHAAAAVWYDIEVTGPAAVAAGAAHLYGRGVWGLVWAIRHAVLRLRQPATRIAYGSGDEQYGELRLPPATNRPCPVAVLLHGGFWRSVWAADLMDALAIDLAARGFAAWNLEYRRPDRHGWAATVNDVAAGLAALSDVDADLDLDWIAVLGHSAGAQLALRAAADHARARADHGRAAADHGRVATGHGQVAADHGRAAAGRGEAGAGHRRRAAAGRGDARVDDGRARADRGRVALAVSLAGVLDLAGGDGRGIGTGAVTAALGGPRYEVPEVYAAADPMARVPIGVPQLVVQGADDDLDLIDFSRRYVAAARAAGDGVQYLEEPGDHFAVIDPAAPLWRATAEAIEKLRDSEQRPG